MKINENFIMKMQSYMFTIVMIFLLIFGVGSLVTTGTLKVGDTALAEALAKKNTDSQSAVINNNEQNAKNVKVIKDKKDTKGTSTDNKKDKVEATTVAPTKAPENNRTEQQASPVTPVRTVTSTPTTSFNIQLGQAPELVWSAIEISAVKPTMPSPTQKTNPTTAPTQSTTVPETKPTEEVTTVPTEPTEATTEVYTTEPTEAITSEPTVATEPTDTEGTTSGSIEETTEPHTFEPTTVDPTESQGTTSPSDPDETETTEPTGTTTIASTADTTAGTTAGTEATTVDPSTSSTIPAAETDITSVIGEQPTTMPEGIDGAGNQKFGANSGNKALNTATLGKGNADNTTMLGTLLIISIILSVVAIMLLGVYFHIKKQS